MFAEHWLGELKFVAEASLSFMWYVHNELFVQNRMDSLINWPGQNCAVCCNGGIYLQACIVYMKLCKHGNYTFTSLGIQFGLVRVLHVWYNVLLACVMM